jgi:hypothetical protein
MLSFGEDKRKLQCSTRWVWWPIDLSGTNGSDACPEACFRGLLQRLVPRLVLEACPGACSEAWFRGWFLNLQAVTNPSLQDHNILSVFTVFSRSGPTLPIFFFLVRDVAQDGSESSRCQILSINTATSSQSGIRHFAIVQRLVEWEVEGHGVRSELWALLGADTPEEGEEPAE